MMQKEFVMNRWLTILGRRLDFETKDGLQKRVDTMQRQLSFLEEKKSQKLALARQHGWTDEKFEILFSLSSFFQMVVGPLASIARQPACGLGSKVPIQHGKTITINSVTINSLESLYGSFLYMVNDLGIGLDLMEVSNTEDLVYRIWRDLTREGQ